MKSQNAAIKKISNETIAEMACECSQMENLVPPSDFLDCCMCVVLSMLAKKN